MQLKLQSVPLCSCTVVIWIDVPCGGDMAVLTNVVGVRLDAAIRRVIEGTSGENAFACIVLSPE